MDGEEVEYTGTIWALSASSVGTHPFTCSALVYGKTSSLKRKLIRSSKLKHPSSDRYHATKSGVNHKFCSSVHLQNCKFIRLGKR